MMARGKAMVAYVDCFTMDIVAVGRAGKDTQLTDASNRLEKNFSTPKCAEDGA